MASDLELRCLPMSHKKDVGVASSIPARSYTFVENDHEIISTVILPPFEKCCCQYKRKYVHEVLVKRLFKLAQEYDLVCDVETGLESVLFIELH